MQWSSMSGNGQSHRPAGRFLWPPRHLPPAALEHAALRELLDQAQRVAEARAQCDEPERVDSRAIVTYAETARKHDTLRRAAEIEAARVVRATLRAEDRLRDVERRARQSRRRDLRGEVMALRGMLAREQRRGIEPAPDSALVIRLERVEASLDGADIAA